MSQAEPESLLGKCALITGAARRIGAAIAELLHSHGVNVAIHYRGAQAEAQELSDKGLELDPISAGALATKAELSLYVGDFDDAIKWGDACVNARPN